MTDIPFVTNAPNMRGSDLITAWEFFQINKASTFITVVISSFGIFTNGINLTIFRSIGFQESVNICLFLLSLSDELMLIIAFYNCSTGYLLSLTAENDIFLEIDAMSLNRIGGQLREVLYSVSMLTTTYLAVARCCCVALPFHFRGVFTRGRTCTVLALMTAFAAVSRAHLFSTMRLVRIIDERRNLSQIAITNTDGFRWATYISYIINDILLTIVPQIVVSLCVVIMSIKLHAAYTFRQASTGIGNKSSSNLAVTKGKANKEAEFSAKELQVVTQVTLVSTIFIMSNMPKIIVRIVNWNVPGFGDFGQYFFTFLLMKTISVWVEVFSATINIFVYYKFNSKFRMRFFELFKRKKSADAQGKEY